MDKEAIRVVKSLPKFKPGILNGNPVRVNMVFPVDFKL
jgi:protein TonB